MMQLWAPLLRSWNGGNIGLWVSWQGRGGEFGLKFTNGSAGIALDYFLHSQRWQLFFDTRNNGSLVGLAQAADANRWWSRRFPNVSGTPVGDGLLGGHLWCREG